MRLLEQFPYGWVLMENAVLLKGNPVSGNRNREITFEEAAHAQASFESARKV